jgi:cell division septation protein DedD
MAKRDSGRDQDDDDAPWLAEASTRPQTRVSKRSFFWTAAILLALVAVLAIGTIMLLSKKDSGSAEGYMNAEQAPLIAAEPGPFKVAPADPKGLAVEGQDQTIYAAGEGIDEGSVIDQSAVPEAPLPRPGTEPPPGLPTDLVPEGARETTQAPLPGTPPPPLIIPPPAAATPKPVTSPPAKSAAAPAAKPAAPTAKPAAPAAKPAPPAAKAGTVQLGAFSSAEKAESAWAAMAARTPGLSGHRVVPVEVGGKTLYRLRATGPAGVCAKVKAAGDACTEVN